MKRVMPIRHLHATVRVPGSKSFTQRALIAAALCQGRSRIEGALISEDTEYLMGALAKIGVIVDRSGCDVTVTGTGGRMTAPADPIFMGNNGTGLRLLTGAVCAGDGVFVIDGNERMRQRPIQPLVDGLRQVGADVVCTKGNGCPPVRIAAQGLAGGDAILVGGVSSQFLSSLLLVAPCAERDTVIRVAGDMPSWPYVQMTLDVMARFGVEVIARQDRSFFIAAPQPYRATTYTVEGDASSATYFMAAAAVCGGKVRIANIHAGSTQGDMRFGEILRNFGCTVSDAGGGLTGLIVQGPLTHHGDLCFDLQDVPDMVPALAVVCAFRKGKTVLRRIGHLRVKECDRIAALTKELRKIGATVDEKSDEMTVQGVASKGAQIDCYEDHRIAMSFAVAGLAMDGVVIKDPVCVKKSFPDFWEQLELLQNGEA